MKKFAWFALLGFVFILLTGCVVTKPTVAPPPPRSEVIPSKPGPNSVWIAGYWKWTGSTYVWVGGYWSKNRPGKVWVPGHWERKGPHWVWKQGHWR